jgi:succinate dehydrogenase / fumarate reductase iron-sulfur subunit
MSARQVHLRVLRQDDPELPGSRRWEEFAVPLRPRMTVADALLHLQQHPVTTQGTEVAPIAWEVSCMQESCGACALLINGKPGIACGVFVDTISPTGKPISLAPLSGFPLVRDLVVDRSRMAADLVRVRAWTQLDGLHDQGPGPRESPEEQRERQALGRCISCGICLEACPQIHEGSAFVGPAAIHQVRLLKMHPTGAMQAGERLERLMGEGGVADCGKAQNCVEVCPQRLPLVTSLAVLSRDTSLRLIRRWFLGAD